VFYTKNKMFRAWFSWF